jgi:hypothetical protein
MPVIAQGLSVADLDRQNREFLGTGGRSEENGSAGFQPAFLDTETRSVYPSRFRDGRRAPIHMLDGLPEPLVLARDAVGRVAAVKRSIVAGFARNGRFYTRDEAARHAAAAPAW